METIIKIIKLPDGRIAIENARDQSCITTDELREIPSAVRTWWFLMWDLHFPEEIPNANF